MTPNANSALKISHTLQQVNDCLACKPVSHPSLARALEDARNACATLLLDDFKLASSEKVEDRLWNVHVKANAHFRDELRKPELKTGEDARAVERRKLSGDYLKFLKSSQKFFRSYVRSLDQWYGGIDQLRLLAGKLGPENAEPFSSKPGKQAIDRALRDLVVRSAFRTLIQLGDMSRYRELAIAGHIPNWSYAVGYYDLAGCILPESGLASHQLAIIAMVDENLFQATYYLFRSLAASERHPQAESNLRKAFSKISAAWENSRLMQSASPLVAWHLRLVSQCYYGKPFADHERLEEQACHYLHSELNKFSMESTIRKLFLINFAACFAAQERFTASPNTEEHFQSYTFYLRLNLKYVSTLLRCMEEQLRLRTGKGASSSPFNIESNLRKLLCPIRLSMMWVAKNARVLTNPVSPDIDRLQLEIWARLASCLDLTLNLFDVQSLTESHHLLEEDEDTIAFEPLLCDQINHIWYDEQHQVRQRRHESTDEARNVDLEAQARLKFFLKCGTEFALDQGTPLQYDFERATFHSLQQPSDPQSATRSFQNTVLRETGNVPLQSEDPDEKDAERMVSSLVGAEPLPEENGKLLVTPTSENVESHTAHDLLLSFQNGAHPSNGGAPRATAPQLKSVTRPFSGMTAGPNTPDRSSAQHIRGPIARPHSASLTANMGAAHSRGQSVDSDQSHQPMWQPDGTWNSYRPPSSSAASGNGALASVMGLGNGTFGGQQWTGGPGKGLGGLYGPGPGSLMTTGQDSRRMSPSSPRIGGSHSLRRESGASPGAIGSGRSNARPSG